MTTLTELCRLAQMRHVELKDVRWLWHSSYYDGPLSGLVLFEGSEAWVECFDDIVLTRGEGDEMECMGARRFAIMRLTPEELEHEKAEHALFQKYVGTHTDYHEDGKRDVGAVKPSSEHDQFYKRERKERDYSDHDVIAWFEW